MRIQSYFCVICDRPYAYVLDGICDSCWKDVQIKKQRERLCLILCKTKRNYPIKHKNKIF